MSPTAIKGIVENGRIRLQEDVVLPEHTKVLVIVAEGAEQNIPRVRTPRLVHPEQASDFRKQIVEIPADAKL
jgi:hypothetical protein